MTNAHSHCTKSPCSHRIECRSMILIKLVRRKTSWRERNRNDWLGQISIDSDKYLLMTLSTYDIYSLRIAQLLPMSSRSADISRKATLQLSSSILQRLDQSYPDQMTAGRPTYWLVICLPIKLQRLYDCRRANLVGWLILSVVSAVSYSISWSSLVDLECSEE